MKQEENDKQVTEFLAVIVNKLPEFIDKGIMDSFDVKFSYGNSHYQLALIKDGKVHGEDFKIMPN